MSVNRDKSIDKTALYKICLYIFYDFDLSIFDKINEVVRQRGFFFLDN